MHEGVRPYTHLARRRSVGNVLLDLLKQRLESRLPPLRRGGRSFLRLLRQGERVAERAQTGSEDAVAAGEKKWVTPSGLPAKRTVEEHVLVFVDVLCLRRRSRRHASAAKRVESGM